MEDIIYTTPLQVQDFFNFKFEILGGQVIKCTMDDQVLDTAIWSSLFLIKQKYDEKNEKMKKRKKMFDEHQRHYMEDLAKRIDHKERMTKHIQKAESKLTEYKNTILAFGKLASTGAIQK